MEINRMFFEEALRNQRPMKARNGRCAQMVGLNPLCGELGEFRWVVVYGEVPNPTISGALTLEAIRDDGRVFNNHLCEWDVVGWWGEEQTPEVVIGCRRVHAPSRIKPANGQRYFAARMGGSKGWYVSHQEWGGFRGDFECWNAGLLYLEEEPAQALADALTSELEGKQ